jgi:wyosine [tRNA(Phe)-imidazoG37] synthetase (radical SAM superfamily)
MDNFEIDSHKLVYHPERVAEWRRGYKNWETAKSVYPIYVEVSPSGACNHRCTFCAKDYIGYANIQIDPGVLKNSLSEMASLGVKSVMFAGEGEPTLYKFLPDVLDHCREIGIDTSLTTNMVPFNRDNIEAFLNCAWIKVSINAGTADTYSKIHQCKPSDFDRVLKNFEMVLEIRDKGGHCCTLGAQMVLLTDNAKEAYLLGERLKKMGVDYLVIKPYSQHPKSFNRSFENIDYGNFVGIEKDLEKLNDDKFSLIFRENTINRTITKKHEFPTCHAVPFFSAHVMANSNRENSKTTWS